jgi:uncharacterized protein with HEPN domain
MSFEPRDYLRHILVEADYLIRESDGLEADDFMSNGTLQRAFVRSIEIMGEAAKNVPSDFRDQHPDVDWRRLAGMRDRLIHSYFGVDYAIVWDVVRSHVPELRHNIALILGE